MALAVVTRIPNFAEAQIAAGALRSAGIDAEVFDVGFGQIEAPVIEQLGGFRIMAPEEEAAAARQILMVLRASPGLGEPDEYAEPWAPVSRGRRWPWRVMILISSALTLLWLIQALRG